MKYNPHLNLVPSAAKALINNCSDPDVRLQGCFIWRLSPQGFTYWNNRYRDLLLGKPLSKTAKLHIQRMLNSYTRHHNG